MLGISPSDRPEPLIAESARKHGIADEDMLHAYRNAIYRHDMNQGVMVLVGASWSGALLEIGVAQQDGEPVIIHAMPARQKFMR